MSRFDALAPSPGPPIVVRTGQVTATLFPTAGGRIGQLTVGDRDLLRGPDHAEAGWAQWGSYPLVPWSNRIPAGRFTFGGRTFAVPVNWDDGTAIHGLTAWLPWQVDHACDDSAALSIAVQSGDYAVSATQFFRVDAAGVDAELTVRNDAAWAVPVGLGIHPWFAAAPVRVPADRYWPGEPMPAGEPLDVTASCDLRTLGTAPTMDRCYTALTGNSATIGGVELRWGGPITQVIVFSGFAEWVCVEPVTMATDGFAMAADGPDGHGVVALQPGESLAVTYRFDVSGLLSG